MLVIPLWYSRCYRISLLIGHVPKIDGRSVGPDAMNMMRLKQYSDMQKKLNKRATLNAGKIDMNAYGIRGDLFSQNLIKDRNDRNSEHHFPAVLVSFDLYIHIHICFSV